MDKSQLTIWGGWLSLCLWFNNIERSCFGEFVVLLTILTNKPNKPNKPRYKLS